MLENKYPEYENYRLLDELEQYLFIFEHCDFVKDRSDKYMPLCKHFPIYLTVLTSCWWLRMERR